MTTGVSSLERIQEKMVVSEKIEAMWEISNVITISKCLDIPPQISVGHNVLHNVHSTLYINENIITALKMSNLECPS